jgi:phospholipid/cholesterol/gamma-HCH transport system substrate-binding protein
MITRSQKIKLVVFLLGTTLVGVALLVLFTGHTLFKQTNVYYIRVPGSVSGIETGAEVAVRGVKVGKVKQIELYADDSDNVRLTLEIDANVPIRKDAEASLSFKGVTGIKFVDISGGRGHKANLAPNSYIQYQDSTLQRVTDQAEELVARATELLTSTNKLVENLANVTARLDGSQVDAILQSTQQAVARFEGAGAELQQLVKETRAPIARTIGSAEIALQGAGRVTTDASAVMANLNATLMELKTVIKQNEEHVRATTFNLREASQSFKNLARELRQRPSRLLISEAPEERELP